MNNYYGIGVLLAAVGLMSGCAATVTKPGHENLNSTLWLQTASEYKAHSIQVFNSANKTISQAVNDQSWSSALEQDAGYSSLPAAVIFDVDETVLDTSGYQAQLVIDWAGFAPETWDTWISLQNAPALPGAVDFINTLGEMNVEVIYITNRECKPRKIGGAICPQEQDTIENLKKVGVQSVRPENVMLKGEEPGWSSEKKSRREVVVAKYRVVMMFGDDLGDFLTNVKKNISPSQRDELVGAYRANWGKKWYLLSNPTYGSWLRVLDDPKSKYLKGYSAGAGSRN